MKNYYIYFRSWCDLDGVCTNELSAIRRWISFSYGICKRIAWSFGDFSTTNIFKLRVISDWVLNRRDLGFTSIMDFVFICHMETGLQIDFEHARLADETNFTLAIDDLCSPGCQMRKMKCGKNAYTMICTRNYIRNDERVPKARA